MRLAEIKAIAAETAKSNLIVQTLCAALLRAHETNARMAADMATMLEELNLNRVTDAEIVSDDEPITEVNTQLYGVGHE